MVKRKNSLRRAVALLLVLLLTAALLPPVRAAEGMPFLDVREKDYFRKPVLWAWQEGITAGTDALHFSPRQALRFSEIAVFLYRYAYSPTPHYSHPALNAYRTQYYYRALNWCCDFGILELSQITGAHKPTERLTRNDFVNILYRYALLWERRSLSPDPDCLSPFLDAPAGETDRAAWSWAVSEGVVSGTGPQSLSPDQQLTRAQFVTMLYRLETRPEPLRSETLSGRRLRGWQRTLAAAGELAYGASWVDEAYELGPDGIPTVIDCSGFVNWCFCQTGIRPYEDLDCQPLWASDLFTRLLEKQSGETGSGFLLRCREQLQPGDLLFGRSASTNHIMIFLYATSDTLYVLHSRSEAGVRAEALPISENSSYVRNLYGVMRHVP